MCRFSFHPSFLSRRNIPWSRSYVPTVVPESFYNLSWGMSEQIKGIGSGCFPERNVGSGLTTSFLSSVLIFREHSRGWVSFIFEVLMIPWKECGWMSTRLNRMACSWTEWFFNLIFKIHTYLGLGWKRCLCYIQTTDTTHCIIVLFSEVVAHGAQDSNLHNTLVDVTALLLIQTLWTWRRSTEVTHYCHPKTDHMTSRTYKRSLHDHLFRNNIETPAPLALMPNSMHCAVIPSEAFLFFFFGPGLVPPISAFQTGSQPYENWDDAFSSPLRALFELTFTFIFYAVSAEHRPQFFRETLFDLRMSQNAWYVFAPACA